MQSNHLNKTARPTGWLKRQSRLTPTRLNILAALGLVLLYNASFWQHFQQVHPTNSISSFLFALSCVIVLTCAILLLLAPLAFKPVQKPLLIMLLFVSSLCTYFLTTFGIPFDGSTVQNVLESNLIEMREYFNFQVVIYVLLLGILPGWLCAIAPIQYGSFKKQILWILTSFIAAVLIIILNFGIFFQDYSSLFRNHRELRFLVNPLNYLYATPIYILRKPAAPTQLNPIGLDAEISSSAMNSNKKIMVLVVGETARADHFSLNGYARNTNPQLARQDIINFSAVSSCGTATAISLPCMFSHFDRQNFSVDTAKQYENIIDILARVGVDVTWRDNNSGCKGLCDRVAYQDVSQQDVAELCDSEECFDEILLEKLTPLLDGQAQNKLLILHQKGSHGPAYFQRSPEKYKAFFPECQTSQLQKCSQQEIINAYDNSILYTDAVLDKLIKILNEHSAGQQVGLLYISDHGESLGENNLYLHGMPYRLAPPTQTHIPMLLWLSAGLQQHIRKDCLEKNRGNPYSHDNLFHSLLGFFDVKTSLYQKDLDIFSSCK